MSPIRQYVMLFSIVGALTCQGQSISPIWENLITKPDPSIPILKGAPLPSLADDAFDGTSLADSYSGFKRYDDNRLLLAVRENGINESDPNHDSDLANSYPDRSLVWIDPANGAYLGIAVEVGHSPVELDEDFLAEGGTTLDYYFSFGVAEDGIVYVGYKNKILRYAPDGANGFSSPSVAFTRANDSSANWFQWRWDNFRISGSGADTVILAGGKTWRPNQGYYQLTTSNGVDFDHVLDPSMPTVPNGFGRASGGASEIVEAIDPEFPGDVWIYVSSYPGSSRGDDTTFYRFIGFPPFDEPFTKDDEFSATKNTIAPLTAYRTEFITDLATKSDLDFVVAYSTPSWNSRAIEREARSPGWLAVHGVDGAIRSVYLLDVTEDDEVIPDDSGSPNRSSATGTLGSLELNILGQNEDGSDHIELLWFSGIYGFGRYQIEKTLFDETGAVYYHFDNGLTDANGNHTLIQGLVDDPEAGSLPTLFNEGSSGIATDLAASFDGSQANHVIDASGALQIEDTDYTLEAWIKIEGPLPSRRIIFGYGIPGGYSLSVAPDNTLFTTTYGIADIPSSASLPDDGAWHHVAVVHENMTEMRFYIDGTLGDSISYTQSVNRADDQTFYVGHEINGVNPWLGSIDRIRITRTALEPDQFDLNSTSSPTQTNINIATNPDRSVTLSWDGSGTLQSSDRVAGPWVDEANATSPTQTEATESQRFYRIQN
jgi:hypothetical protein